MEYPSGGRDFSTISPSAQSLLLLKELTNIPFARQAAGLMLQSAAYLPDTENRDTRFWSRVLHFENRYWSIDQLLSDLPARNILELSSGFSFRGLATVMEKPIHYIDTDLTGLIEIKQSFVTTLQAGLRGPVGSLETLPLNALDRAQFADTVNRFPPGEDFFIVNEGLLMYLDIVEKKELCAIIHQLLSERGGYWITADIYIKARPEEADLKIDDRLNRFFEQHRIRENMFDSFDGAEAFFKNAGFLIDKEAVPDHSRLSSLPYLRDAATAAQMERIRNAGRIRTTWRLRVA